LEPSTLAAPSTIVSTEESRTTAGASINAPMSSGDEGCAEQPHVTVTSARTAADVSASTPPFDPRTFKHRSIVPP
jgi:hypothetical protein